MKIENARLALLIFFAAVGLWAAGCDFAVSGSLTPHGTAVVDPDIDADNIAPGQAVTVTLTAENVYLIEPGETPPAGHEDDAGHFQIYLDDTDTEPLLVTAQLNVTVTVPADITPGGHQLLCRIHKHNGQPTDTVIEVNITVVVSTGGEGEGE